MARSQAVIRAFVDPLRGGVERDIREQGYAVVNVFAQRRGMRVLGDAALTKSRLDDYFRRVMIVGVPFFQRFKVNSVCASH